LQMLFAVERLFMSVFALAYGMPQRHWHPLKELPGQPKARRAFLDNRLRLATWLNQATSTSGTNSPFLVGRHARFPADSITQYGTGNPL
jgi:hypothetical protein